MFKIARIAKQISNASQIIKKATTSISSMFQHLQHKGYIEDARDEFIFAKVLPNHSLNQDKLSSFYQESNNVAKPQSIDRFEIRKLIYARFADEIGRKPSKGIGSIKGIAEEFEGLRERGYNFKELKGAIARNSASQDLEEQNSGDNSASRSLSERMKELVISGYLSNYSGEAGLRQDIEEVMNRKALVTEEFMNHLNHLQQSSSNAFSLSVAQDQQLITDSSIPDIEGVQHELSILG